jgi:uncharacterized membrane protein
VCGIAGFGFCFLPSIVGLVLGYVAKAQIDRSQGLETGRGLAIAGIVLGWVAVGIAVLLTIALVIAAATGESSDDTDVDFSLAVSLVLAAAGR